MFNKTSTSIKKNTYILIGGGCSAGVSCDNLANEISEQLSLKGLPICNLLFVNFGKEEQFWQKTIEKYEGTVFREFSQRDKLRISVASFNATILAEQLRVADVIFFTGGSELSLKKHITKKLIPKENKIIIGNSAGTNLFSKSYFSNDRGRLEKGIGILPINTICHFSPEKQESLNRLSQENKFPTFPIEHDRYITLLY